MLTYARVLTISFGIPLYFVYSPIFIVQCNKTPCMYFIGFILWFLIIHIATRESGWKNMGSLISFDRNSFYCLQGVYVSIDHQLNKEIRCGLLTSSCRVWKSEESKRNVESLLDRKSFQSCCFFLIRTCCLFKIFSYFSIGSTHWQGPPQAECIFLQIYGVNISFRYCVSIRSILKCISRRTTIIL